MKKISKSFYLVAIFVFLSLKLSKSQQLTNFDNNNEPIGITHIQDLLKAGAI